MGKKIINVLLISLALASVHLAEAQQTGVFYRDTDVTPKRLEILKEIVPKLHRVVTFYNPRNPVAGESAKLVREAAGQMGIQLVERHVASVEELRATGAIAQDR